MSVTLSVGWALLIVGVIFNGPFATAEVALGVLLILTD